jgi:hypothetical protein
MTNLAQNARHFGAALCDSLLSVFLVSRTLRQGLSPVKLAYRPVHLLTRHFFGIRLHSAWKPTHLDVMEGPIP